MSARLAILAILTVTGTGRASAQAVSAAAVAAYAEHRVEAGWGVERSAGAIGGARVTVAFLRRIELAAHALGGALEREGAQGEDRDFGQIGVDARYHTLPWLSLEAGAATRVYSTSIARQRWSMLKLGGEARVALAGGLEGLGRFHVLPLVSISGLDQPDLAAAAAAGIEYRGGLVSLTLLYELERHDFPPRDAGSPSTSCAPSPPSGVCVRRAEQISTLVVELGLRILGRRRGP